MMSRVVVGLAAVLTISAAASAQTLGDVARQEEARRKTVKDPAKVYTNDSLRADPSSPRPAAAGTPGSGASSAGSGSAAPSTPDASQQAGASPAVPDARAKDEAAWKKRIADAREAGERAKLFAEALQTRINSLSNDWAARDDPYQRAKISGDRDKALAELGRVQKEIQDGNKAIAAIQEEARKAGVPAGWVR
jgi:hypothetical protein